MPRKTEQSIKKRSSHKLPIADRKRKTTDDYSQNVLGYRAQRSERFKLVDSSKRMAILFDNMYHRKSVKDLIKEHHVNYSTVRHILAQYYLFGRTEGRKFKQKPSNDFSKLQDERN